MGNENSIIELCKKAPKGTFLVVGCDKGISKKSKEPYIYLYLAQSIYSSEGFGFKTFNGLYITASKCSRFDELYKNISFGQYIRPSYFINGSYTELSDITIVKAV